MFWIGLIVGIMLPVLVYFVAYTWVTRSVFRNPDEYWDTIGLVYDGALNRESELQLIYDGEVQDSVILEEFE